MRGKEFRLDPRCSLKTVDNPETLPPPHPPAREPTLCACVAACVRVTHTDTLTARTEMTVCPPTPPMKMTRHKKHTTKEIHRDAIVECFSVTHFPLKHRKETGSFVFAGLKRFLVRRWGSTKGLESIGGAQLFGQKSGEGAGAAHYFHSIPV